jgi:hypothetical protein
MIVKMLSRAIKAFPILLQAVRPVMELIAWPCFLLLLLFWVIETVYCVNSYIVGGWPALLGYVQGISQGHSPSSVSWGAIAVGHFLILTLTLLLAWFLRESLQRARPRKP